MRSPIFRIECFRIEPAGCTLGPSREPFSFATFNPGSPYQGLYVNLRRRFAFCTIEKVASSAWRFLFGKFGKVANPQDWIVFDRNLTQYTQPYIQKLGQGVIDLFADSTAIKAVFIRDPLARFVSVFMNKCLQHNCSNLGGYCLPMGRDQVGTAISFAQAVDWAVSLPNEAIRSLDPHWGPQFLHCELHRRVNEFNFVALMTAETLPSTASCLMKVAGLDQFNYGKQNRSMPYWNPIQHSVYRSAIGSGANETERLQKLFSPERALALMNKFADDYRIFNIPFPAWVAGATGEWENRSASTCLMPWEIQKAEEAAEEAMLKATFKHLDKGNFCRFPKEDLLQRFVFDPRLANISAIAARTRCERYCLNDNACWGCTVHWCCGWMAIKSCVQSSWPGLIDGDVTIKVQATTATTTRTITTMAPSTPAVAENKTVLAATAMASARNTTEDSGR